MGTVKSRICGYSARAVSLDASSECLTATPMFDCFTKTPDLTPFTAVASNIPFDKMNPEPRKVSDPLLRKEAYASVHLPLDQPDRCPEDLLNRILWHAMKGPQAPYPEWAVRTQVDRD